MEKSRSFSVYVMSAETPYVEKTRKNKIADLWHARSGYVSYKKLKIMIMKPMSGLLILEVREETICAGGQNGKMHQLPYQKSKFRVWQPLDLIYSDVFGPVKQPSVGGPR